MLWIQDTRYKIQDTRYKIIFLGITLVLIATTKTSYAQEVLTKVGGGASWETPPSSDGNGIYGGSDDLSTSTTVSMGTNNLHFTSTGGDLSMQGSVIVDASEDKVGINTGTPNATLHINGSAALGVTNLRLLTSYTLTQNECFILIDPPSGGIELTLPDPTTCPGRVYHFFKVTGGSSIKFDSPIRYTVAYQTPIGHIFGGNVKLSIISSGTEWWKL